MIRISDKHRAVLHWPLNDSAIVSQSVTYFVNSSVVFSCLVVFDFYLPIYKGNMWSDLISICIRFGMRSDYVLGISSIGFDALLSERTPC